MIDNLRSQRETGKFCDIVLHVGGKRFPAHRSVLAASSPYFESILRHDKVAREEITIGWEDVESFQLLLDYMYSGNVTIDENNVNGLLRLSTHFLISKLQGYCQQYLEQTEFNFENDNDNENGDSNMDGVTIKEEQSQTDEVTGEENDEDDGGHSANKSKRRKVKRKYTSEEWITDEISVSKRLSPEQTGESRRAVASIQSGDESLALDDSSQEQRQWKEGIKCPHCIYVGNSATRLEQHLSRVHEEDTTYKCRLCDFTCNWNREYYRHMKCHYRGPPFKCEDCEYTCDRIQFILSHVMRHTDERPFQCKMCPFKSRTKGNLEVHMRIHTGEKPYKCQFCDRGFAMKNTLDQHLATHRDDRPFLCDTCGFTTKYQSHLLSHKRIHTGNVFHCTHEGCNYFSPRRSQLAAHERSHSSIRSHICVTCGRGFIEKSHLIRHERIHLEDKPFKCDVCDYESTRRDKLKEHVLKHHSGDAKTPASYKPRKTRRQSQVTVVEESSIPELSDSQLIVTTPGEVQIAASEQEVATANLIYEYQSDGGTPIKTLVIQNMENEGESCFLQLAPSS
ncbi:zinc finger protein 436-like [Tetranychus urticae]|nr:zinc finger protein 436-like [Tetranychus urticae]